MTAAGLAINRLATKCHEKGLWRTALLVLETFLRPLARVRRRLVYQASLDVPYAPPAWPDGTRLVLIKPEDRGSVPQSYLAPVNVHGNDEDWLSMKGADRLVTVAQGDVCVHRYYLLASDPPMVAGHERKAIFFGELRKAPLVRAAETPASARGRGLYRRALVEGARYLQALGYPVLAMYIMAENTASIRAAEAAGFKLRRTLKDWVILNWIVLQRVSEPDRARYWRFFLQ